MNDDDERGLNNRQKEYIEKFLEHNPQQTAFKMWMKMLNDPKVEAKPTRHRIVIYLRYRREMYGEVNNHLRIYAVDYVSLYYLSN